MNKHPEVLPGGQDPVLGTKLYNPPSSTVSPPHTLEQQAMGLPGKRESEKQQQPGNQVLKRGWAYDDDEKRKCVCPPGTAGCRPESFHIVYSHQHGLSAASRPAVPVGPRHRPEAWFLKDAPTNMLQNVLTL